jgi:hypothetical protein
MGSFARTAALFIHAVTASISRTHSQCQREGRTPQSARAKPMRRSGLHTWRNVEGDPHAVSRGEAAPYGALRPAGRPCSRCELASLIRLRWLRWWSQPGSNRRPQACKASALPTELWPRRPTRMVRMFPLAMGGGKPVARQSRVAMVGRVGVEPTTSRLSGVRSNHLSYRPPHNPGRP